MFIAVFSIFIMLLGLVMVYFTSKEARTKKEAGPRAFLFDKLYEYFSKHERENELRAQTEADKIG